MPAYEYQALDAKGKKRKGYIDADSERAARQQLRDQQLTPLSLASSQKSVKRTRSQRVPSREVALFTQQFAALVQSAVPLEEALRVSADQARHKGLKVTLQAVRSKVLEGHSLAEGMAEHPKVFSAIYRALVGAGEHSGELGKVLLRLAEYTERSQQLRSTVTQAAIYPLVLTLVAISVITILMAFVVPKVVEQFTDSGQALPLLTRIMIYISDLIVERGWLILAVLVALALLWRALLKRPGFLLSYHRKLLSLPLLGGLISSLETARLLGTLSIMINSGLPLLEALQVSRQTVENRYVQQLIGTIWERVREGKPLSQQLAEAKVFPPIATYMVANGEHSGELGKALEQAARQQETQLNGVVAIATKLIEPLLIIIFGVLVLAIVLAILLPILQLNNISQF